MNLEEPILEHICTLTRYLRVPIFIQILNVIDLHFQGQSRFTIMCAIKTSSIDIFGDVVAHDIDLLLEGHIFESKPFG